MSLVRLTDYGEDEGAAHVLKQGLDVLEEGVHGVRLGVSVETKGTAADHVQRQGLEISGKKQRRCHYYFDGK